MEKAGIPVVQVCNMKPVADSVGVNRIWTSPSIKYPFGAPQMTPDAEKEERVKHAKSALEMLTE